MNNLNSLTPDERLALLLELAGLILQDMPDSMIASQICYHAAILNGKSRYGEKTVTLRALQKRR